MLLAVEEQVWLPDNTGLIVSDGRPSSIFVVSLETGERRELVAAPDVGFLGGDVVLSPDGQTLAFNSGEFVNLRMQLLDLGADFEPIAPPRMIGSAGLGRAFPLAWSPDGSSLIVGTIRGLTPELGRLSIADPDRVQPLAFAGPGSVGAAVSARANRLVFGRNHLDWNLGVLRHGTGPLANRFFPLLDSNPGRNSHPTASSLCSNPIVAVIWASGSAMRMGAAPRSFGSLTGLPPECPAGRPTADGSPLTPPREAISISK